MTTENVTRISAAWQALGATGTVVGKLWAWLLLAVVVAVGFSGCATSCCFDKAYIESRLPPGCTATPQTDWMNNPAPKPNSKHLFEPGLIWGDARNQPTCREWSPVEVWPHAHIPKPDWPLPETPADPSAFDLKAGQAKEGDPIVAAYFKHLCQREAGEFFYRQVKEKQPVSAINLRPRRDYADNVPLFDMYWIEGKASFYADMPMTGWDYKGGERYGILLGKRGKEDPNRPKGVVVEGEGVNRRIYFVSETGERFDTKQWSALSPLRWQGNPLFVERPLKPEEQKKYPEAKFMRYTYAMPEQRRLVTLADGDKALLVRFTGDPDPMDCPMDHTPCELEYKATHGPQKRTTTPVAESKAQYGYTWREITRSPEDLRLGILGSETMVIDMRTGEVVALRRDFAISHVPDKPYALIKTMRSPAFTALCGNLPPYKFGYFLQKALGLNVAPSLQEK